jgi:ubiquinone/menaquinone biosynthesis C-methylase UbiE
MPIPRVLEPEVMDSFEEATDYDTMDHSEVNRRFVEDLLAAGEVGGDCLDLGAGTAQIPVALCQAAEGFRVAAADLSTAMLDAAVYNVEAAGLTERIALVHEDAKQLTFADESFDVVFSNSIIHHIPDPLQVLREAVRVTRRSGWLFFRDLLRPDSDRQVRQLVDTYAADANEHQRKMFDDSLRAALRLEELAELVRAVGGDPDRQLKATSDRHWTWVARREQLA